MGCHSHCLNDSGHLEYAGYHLLQVFAFGAIPLDIRTDHSCLPIERLKNSVMSDRIEAVSFSDQSIQDLQALICDRPPRLRRCCKPGLGRSPLLPPPSHPGATLVRTPPRLGVPTPGAHLEARSPPQMLACRGYSKEKRPKSNKRMRRCSKRSVI